MRIPPSILFLLASATTVFSSRTPLSSDLATNFPYCSQPCITDAILQYCSNDQTVECCCSDRAVSVFTYLYSCAYSSGCLELEVQNAVAVGYTLCLGEGYDILKAFGLDTTYSGSTAVPSNLLAEVTATVTAFPKPTGTGSYSYSSPDSKNSKKGLSTGVLVGIIVGALALLGIAIGVIVFFIKRRKPAAAPPVVTPQPSYPPAPPPGYPPQQYTYPQQPPQQPYEQPLMGSYQNLGQTAGYYVPPPKHSEAGVTPHVEEPKQYISELPSDPKFEGARR